TPAVGCTRRGCWAGPPRRAPTGPGPLSCSRTSGNPSLGTCSTTWPRTSSASDRLCAGQPLRAGRRAARSLGVRALELDVDGLGALRALLGVERNLCAIGERLGAIGDPRLMDEQVLAALVGGDEAESLLLVEPLHGAGRHASSLCW